MKTFVSVIAYPILLLGNGAFAAWAIRSGQDLGLAALLGVLGSLAYLLILERIIPFNLEWHPSWREWLRDGLYFGMAGAIDGVMKVILVAAAVWLAPHFDWGASSLPLWASIPLAIVIADLGSYWVHRKSHDIPWLWKIHGVHHAPDKVNTFNNNTAHFLNIAFSTTSKLLPILVFGFAPEAVFVAGLVLTVQSFGVHVNADVRLGFLNHVVMGPEHHRLHHSTAIEEAGNHAVALTLWDRAFGTFTWKPNAEPAGVGIGGGVRFPEPNRVVVNQLFPFVASQSQS